MMRTSALYLLLLGMAFLFFLLGTVLLFRTYPALTTLNKTIAPRAVEPPAIAIDPPKDALPRLAIVIDDAGLLKPYEDEFLALSEDLTYAVMPANDRTKAMAEKLAANGIETIIHMPMHSEDGERTERETLILLTNMTRKQMLETLAKAHEEIPAAIGMNNHMGSLGTAYAPMMKTVMEFSRDNNFYFLDSRTTAKTVAKSAGKAAGVITLERTIFLDNEDEIESIRSNMYSAIAMAKKNGTAIAICHYTKLNTMRVLQETLPKFSAYGVELTRLSEIARDANTRN